MPDKQPLRSEKQEKSPHRHPLLRSREPQRLERIPAGVRQAGPAPESLVI